MKQKYGLNWKLVKLFHITNCAFVYSLKTSLGKIDVTWTFTLKGMGPFSGVWPTNT